MAALASRGQHRAAEWELQGWQRGPVVLQLLAEGTCVEGSVAAAACSKSLGHTVWSDLQ